MGTCLQDPKTRRNHRCQLREESMEDEGETCVLPGYQKTPDDIFTTTTATTIYQSDLLSFSHSLTLSPLQNRPARGETPSLGSTKRSHTSLASLLALSYAPEPPGVSRSGIACGSFPGHFPPFSLCPSYRVLLACNSSTHPHHLSSDVWLWLLSPLLVRPLFVFVTLHIK